MTEIVKLPRIVDLLAEGQRVAADLAMGGDDEAELDGKIAKFNAWLSTCEDKALACKCVIKALEADAARYKDAEVQIATRRKAIEKQADDLRARTLTLLDGMEVKRVDNADGGHVRVDTRTTLKVEVTYLPDLPDGLAKVKVEPDLAAIKAYWKEHGAVPGATVTEVQTRSLVVK